MYDAVVGGAIGLITQYGLFVLLVAFALEGALVGKIIPTRTLLVTAVLALGSDTVGIVSAVIVAVAGATLGQLVLFASIRRSELSTESLSVSSTSTDDGRLLGWLDRWGMAAVVLSNALPIARGSLTIPAAMSDGDILRFSVSSMLGTSVYAAGLVGVASGLEAIRWIL